MMRVILLLILGFCNVPTGGSFLSRNLPEIKWKQQATVPNVDLKQTVWTFEELQQYALDEGVQLSISTLGPGFRTVARSTHNSSAILGYGEGFVRPSGDILHLDKMEVFQKMVQQVKQANPKFRGGGSTFGVGLLFGYQCLLHGTKVLEKLFFAVGSLILILFLRHNNRQRKGL
jgi:hypothetical protein